VDDLNRLVQTQPLQDVSPEWAMDYIPTPFEFELGPGMGRVLVADSS
jgi:starch synthase (maltosyl-transferring)